MESDAKMEADAKMESDTKMEEYKKSLTEIQKLALEIAEKHLGSSFDLSKSNGYLSYIDN